ncbi:hypothetical protein SNEBB_008964 [Seison nebaliae]|nr:hypothetical protein SNEBB_008964 [Seison nebaliae]
MTLKDEKRCEIQQIKELQSRIIEKEHGFETLVEKLSEVLEENEKLKSISTCNRNVGDDLEEMVPNEMIDEKCKAECNYYRHMDKENLIKLLVRSKEHLNFVQYERDDLREKVFDAYDDLKLMRKRMKLKKGFTPNQLTSSYSVCFDEMNMSLSSQLSNGNEQHLKDLEELKGKLRDVQVELKSERCITKDLKEEKVELNNRIEQMNLLFQNNEYNTNERSCEEGKKEYFDVASLQSDNLYLKNRIILLENEKSLQKKNLKKLKVKQKINGNIGCLGDEDEVKIINQQQVQEYLSNTFKTTRTNMQTLQTLLKALLETLQDKTIELRHMKRSNRMLGARITELEEMNLDLTKRNSERNPSIRSIAIQTRKKFLLRKKCDEIEELTPSTKYEEEIIKENKEIIKENKEIIKEEEKINDIESIEDKSQQFIQMSESDSNDSDGMYDENEDEEEEKDENLFSICHQFITINSPTKHPVKKNDWTTNMFNRFDKEKNVNFYSPNSFARPSQYDSFWSRLPGTTKPNTKKGGHVVSLREGSRRSIFSDIK